MTARRRRRRAAVEVDVRAHLLESMRERCEKYRDVVDGYRPPWPALVARLEAGEPVEVHVYQLPSEARAGFAPGGRVLVGADGTVEPVRWPA